MRRVRPGPGLRREVSAVVGFELVEIWVIGSEPGLARNLQLLYLGIGLLIGFTATAAGPWRRGPSPNRP